LSNLGIGIDALPEHIRLSKILTGNELGQLGNIASLPDEKAVTDYRRKDFMKELQKRYGHDKKIFREKIHELAKTLLEKERVDEAIHVLLAAE
jgi:hypothetical protein